MPVYVHACPCVWCPHVHVHACVHVCLYSRVRVCAEGAVSHLLSKGRLFPVMAVLTGMLLVH